MTKSGKFLWKLLWTQGKQSGVRVPRYNKLQLTETPEQLDNEFMSGGGLPSLWECENPTTLQYVKEKYPNFFVGSDWWAADPIDATKALQRGLDQELPGTKNGDLNAQGVVPTSPDPKAFNDDILKDGLRDGRVDQSVLRILKAMNAVGLLDRKNWSDSWSVKNDKSVKDTDAYQGFQDSSKNGNGFQFGAEQMDAAARVARKAARDSTVLLRNKVEHWDKLDGTRTRWTNMAGRRLFL